MKTVLDWLLSRNSTSTNPALSIGLLILRVGTGFLMAFGHGLGKLQTYGERSAEFFDPFGVGGPVSLALVVFAEFLCSLALAAGLFTRAAVIPLITTMAVALILVHFDDPFGKQEKAFLFLIPFLTILLTGPGRYSIDRLFARR
jgi:putative oxidoreductase